MKWGIEETTPQTGPSSILSSETKADDCKTIEYFGNNFPTVTEEKKATAYNKIGFDWEYKREYEKAIEYYEKSLDFTIKTTGENSLELQRRLW